MVERQPSCLEWKGPSPSVYGPYHRDRCIPAGMGGPLPRHFHRGGGGLWSLKESMYHINCLELLAGFLAIKCFTKSKASGQVLLLMDNVTAVAYINRMGGTHSLLLSQLAKDLWDWCLSHNVLIKAQYLPGVQNVHADRESRVFLDSSDWKLNTTIFDQMYQR